MGHAPTEILGEPFGRTSMKLLFRVPLEHGWMALSPLQQLLGTVRLLSAILQVHKLFS